MEVAEESQVIEKMERDMGLEPTTSSLGNRPYIVNKEFSAYGVSGVRPEPSYFQRFAPPAFL